jgi:hypothetical protein
MKAKTHLKVATPSVEPAPLSSLIELGSTFEWTRGCNVQKTWRRYGWQPPTEYRNDYFFKINREQPDS